MTRRALLAAGVVAVAAVALAWGRGAPAPDGRNDARADAPAPRPNVLVVVTDDQRADQTLSVMPEVRRRFGRDGTTFTRAFATTPLCCPSRASIFTGQYAHNHGVVDNTDIGPLDHDTTMQSLLRDGGYVTGMFGKFFNSWDATLSPPGFDRWAMLDHGYHGAQFNVQGRMRRVPGSSTEFIARSTVDFVTRAESDDDRPWFAYVAVHAAHRGFEPSPPYRDARVPPQRATPATSERDRSDKPPYVRAQRVDARRARAIRRDQLRTLMSVDDLVGDVFDALERHDETRDTLAIFTSDNGFFWGEHGLSDKRLPYLPSTRVPLLVRWPGRVASGATDGRLAANVDVAPTVLDAAGIEPRHVVDGRSLLADGTRRLLLLEYMADPGFDVPAWSALQSRDLQYVEYEGDGGVAFRELYDLTADRWQVRSLLAGGRDDARAARLARALERVRTCAGTTGPRACP